MLMESKLKKNYGKLWWGTEAVEWNRMWINGILHLDSPPKLGKDKIEAYDLKEDFGAYLPQTMNEL